MPTRQPSNADIILAISTLSTTVGAIQAENQLQHEQNTKKFEGIERRLDYTNGNVKDLLLWQSNLQAIENYKQTQEAQSSPNPKEGVDLIKVLMYALGLVGTALAIIGTVVAK